MIYLKKFFSNGNELPPSVENVGAYLTSFAKYRCQNTLRKKRNQGRILREEVGPKQNYIVLPKENELDRELVHQTIAKMKNKTYKELIRYLLAGFSNVEIAHKMSKSPKWVKSTKYNAQKRLKYLLIKNGLSN